MQVCTYLGVGMYMFVYMLWINVEEDEIKQKGRGSAFHDSEQVES